MPYADPQRRKEYRKEYYEKNKEKLKQRAKDWVKDNYDRYLASTRQWRKRVKQENPRLLMWYGAKRRARENGLEFTIIPSDIVLPEVCPITFLPLVFNEKRLKNNSYTLDRIDSTKGYTPENIAVISHKANSLKSDITLEEAKRLVAYMEKSL